MYVASAGLNLSVCMSAGVSMSVGRSEGLRMRMGRCAVMEACTFGVFEFEPTLQFTKYLAQRPT